MIKHITVEFQGNDGVWYQANFYASKRGSSVVQNVGNLLNEHYANGTQQWIAMFNGTPQDVIEFFKEKKFDTSFLEVVAHKLATPEEIAPEMEIERKAREKQRLEQIALEEAIDDDIEDRDWMRAKNWMRD